MIPEHVKFMQKNHGTRGGHSVENKKENDTEDNHLKTE